MSEYELTDDDRLVMPSHIKRGTPALKTFINSQLEVATAFFFTTQLASRADSTRVAAAKALIGSLGEDDPQRARYEETISRPDLMAKQLAQYRRVHSENLVNNTVNAFNRYLSEAIQACILKQPLLLSSEDTVPVRSIIGLSNMKDVIQILVERRVNKLAYGSISDIADYIEKHLGVRLFPDADREAWVKLAIEVRNINVHSGGVVNAIFLDRVKDRRGETFVLGKRHHTDWPLYTAFTANMVRTACEFDNAIAGKFKLARKRRADPF
jgi:hypothetical protein